MSLVEMAREKARQKNRPTEFRETHSAVERPEFDRQAIVRAAGEAARARAAKRAAELRAPEPQLAAVGPAWTRGEIEKPEGERDIGGSTELYYTHEQQARLGVDEQGNKDKGRSGKALWKTARVKSLAVAKFKQGQKGEPVKPPASVKNALEDAREKAAQKARERDAAPGAPKETARVTTNKPLFGYFHPDGAFATGMRKGITGNPHGHIGNHFRATRKSWFGFGGRRRRRSRRKRGRRRRQKTRSRKRRKTRRKRRKKKTRKKLY